MTGGSGIIKYRGLMLESKDGITVTPELETTEIAIDGISTVADRRVDVHKITITVTPTGKWTNVDRLFPYLSMPAGRLVLPVLPVTITTATDILTIPNHGFYPGDRVMVGIRAGGTLPTSAPQVDATTHYYVHVVDKDTVTLHASRAAAMGNTGVIDFSAAGTGVVIIGQFDLEIIGEDGERITFHAAAITKQPELTLTRTDTPLGEIEWTAYVRQGKRTTDTESFYTLDAPGWEGWTASAEDIRTQSPWVAWANQHVIGGIDGAEVTTGADHGLSTGDIVYFGTTGVLPAAAPALNPEAPYYVRKTGDDTLTLHLTGGDADENENAVAFSGAGTGVHFLTVDNAPFTLVDTEEGVTVSTDVEIEDRVTDRDGVVNARLTDATMEATFTPLSLGTSSIMNMLELQGAGAALGRSLAASGKPLSIFSAGMFVRLNGAAPTAGELSWSMENDRAREITFAATRVVAAGALQPVGRVGSAIA